MRKLISFFTIVSVLFVSLVSFDSFAQNDIDEQNQTVVIDTDNEEIVALLRDMAHELGTTTEYLFEVTVRQGSVAATKSIVHIIISSLLGIIIVFFVRRKSRKEKDKIQDYADEKQDGKLDNQDKESIRVLNVLTQVVNIIVVIAIVGIAMAEMNTVIDGLVNPEYWALDDILSTISDSK